MEHAVVSVEWNCSTGFAVEPLKAGWVNGYFYLF